MIRKLENTPMRDLIRALEQDEPSKKAEYIFP